MDPRLSTPSREGQPSEEGQLDTVPGSAPSDESQPSVAAPSVSDSTLFIIGTLRIPKKPAMFPADSLPRRPSAPGRKLLVLDLDNTLIVTTLKMPATAVHYCASFSTAARDEPLPVSLWVSARPHLATFLEEAARSFDLCLFTASERSVGSPKVDWVESLVRGVRAGQKLFRYRLYREHVRARARSRAADPLSLRAPPGKPHPWHSPWPRC